MRQDFTLNTAANQSYQNLSSGPPSNTLVTGSMAAEDTSAVARRKPKGWIPPTNYQCYSYIRRGAMGVFEVSKQMPGYTLGYRYSGCVGPANNTGPINLGAAFDRALTETDSDDLNYLSNLALMEARKALKGVKVNLGVAFGERNATARMVGDTAKRMGNAIRELRHGRVRNAMQHLGLRSAAGAPRGHNWVENWLQLQYGWKPMLSDIYGSCEALSKLPIETWRVSASGRRRDARPREWLGSPSTVAPNLSYRSSAVGWSGAYVRIDAIPTSGFISSLTSVGVTNPLEVVWELVPYSFVLDWILPIGDWLHSLDAMLGYESATTCTSMMSNWKWSVTGKSGQTPDGYKVIADYSGSKTRIHLRRTVANGVPIPRFPRPKDPRSFGHMANGLALLAQALR